MQTVTIPAPNPAPQTPPTNKGNVLVPTAYPPLRTAPTNRGAIVVPTAYPALQTAPTNKGNVLVPTAYPSPRQYPPTGHGIVNFPLPIPSASSSFVPTVAPTSLYDGTFHFTVQKSDYPLGQPTWAVYGYNDGDNNGDPPSSTPDSDPLSWDDSTAFLTITSDATSYSAELPDLFFWVIGKVIVDGNSSPWSNYVADF